MFCGWVDGEVVVEADVGGRVVDEVWPGYEFWKCGVLFVGCCGEW